MQNSVETFLIIALAFVLLVIATQFARRRRTLFPMREMPAYNFLPLMIGETIEASRPLHIAFGSTTLGAGQTALTLAVAEFAYQVASRASIGAVAPILTMSDSSALPLAQDTLRRAFNTTTARGGYTATDVRWYPAGSRSLAYAAALTAMNSEDDIGAHVLVGSFGPELALIGENAIRNGQSIISASDQLQGQAVAFVISERPLIGEEIFVASAYLSDNAAQRASVWTQDALRWLLIIAILVPTAIAVFQEISLRFFGGGG